MNNSISLEVGDSIEIQDANGKHLHFIIAEASPDEHSLLILVYLSSAETRFKDNTTIIQYGEHPYVTKKDVDSWIRYQNSRVCARNEIIPLITAHYGKISEDLLTRIQKDFEKSRKVPRWIKNLYTEWKMDKLYNSLSQ